MPAFALHVAPPGEVSESADTEHFYWNTHGTSSFASKSGDVTVGPSLAAFGAVPPLNVDAVRIALAVCAADRSVMRDFGGSNWNAREFSVEVAVTDSAAWSVVRAELESLIGFLTGDAWKLTFVQEACESEQTVLPTSEHKRVVLLSGGADSVIGALLTRHELGDDDSFALVSHFTQTFLKPLQSQIATAIAELVPGPQQQHVQVHLSRRSKRADGSSYSREPSSRSRSLLFLTLGLAVASVQKVPLWIPENGFASLNPPLGPDRLGSLSTKTTHPAFLRGLSKVLQSVGAHAEIHNPFASLTKGQMFTKLAEIVGDSEASKLLSLTNSCAHTGHPGPRASSAVPCGVCFGCIVRRSSFQSSGLADLTAYADPSESDAMALFVSQKSVLPSVRSFVARGVSNRDILAMSLPPDMPLDEAMELCAGGMAELAKYCAP